MGTLVHGYCTTAIQVEERKLAHIKIVVSLKLDRGQSFFLSWSSLPAEGSGRISLWISASTPLQFRFTSLQRPEINRQWIEYIMTNSYGPRGAIIVQEDDANIGKPLPPGLV
jgi:hypothetical protein